MKQPQVLLATCGDGDGAALMPKLCSRAGARVAVLSPQEFGVSTSRYVAEHIVVCDDPVQIAVQLRDLLRVRSFDFVVILTDELLYEVYASDPGPLEPYLNVPFAAGSKLVESKNAFIEACRCAGIPVPRFELCGSLIEAIHAAELIGYPLMIKLNHGSSGVGVRPADDASQLQALQESGFLKPPFAVQRRIDGVAGTTSVLYDRGKPLVLGSAYYERSWPTPFHPPTIRQLTHLPELERIARDVGAMTSYHGFGGIDWIQERSTGKVYVLEMNARPMPMHVIAPMLSPYARAFRRLLHGEAAPRTEICGRSGQRYYVFPKDVYRVLDERDLGGIMRWLLRLPFSRDVVPWDDLPLMRLQLQRLRGFVHRRFAPR